MVYGVSLTKFNCNKKEITCFSEQGLKHTNSLPFSRCLHATWPLSDMILGPMIMAKKTYKEMMNHVHKIEGGKLISLETYSKNRVEVYFNF